MAGSESVSSATLQKNKRFAELSAEEMQNIFQNQASDNTTRTIKAAVTTLRKYLIEKGTPIDFEAIRDKNQLDTLLSKFYVEARTVQGDYYKKNSLLSIRNGLNRHLQLKWETPIDLNKDPEFVNSNKMFTGMARVLKANGKAATEHHPPIETKDITEKLLCK